MEEKNTPDVISDIDTATADLIEDVNNIPETNEISEQITDSENSKESEENISVSDEKEENSTSENKDIVNTAVSFVKKLFTPTAVSSPLVKKETFFSKNKYVFVAFAVPFILMLFSFYCSKFYPFGDNQILVIDMWHQYFQFFKVLHEKLQSFGSMLYTWDGGLGTNFIALISYYAASPLYLLSIFVPTQFLTEAMAMIVILKISFSGAFMCIYLKTLFKKCNLATVAFSVLYALCSFAMGYYWCLMWLDVVALLPLCMLGMHYLIDKGKFKLYVISLALMLISNYYIAIMMCMFIVIYYPVVYFSRLKPRGVKYFLVTTGRMAVFSALAACIAAVILIPTYFSMQNTYYIEPSFPTVDTFYNPILNVVSNLLPNVALTYRGGLPNIYCGLVTVMMAILFLLCKKIPVRQKVLNCSILAFLLLSFNWNKLDYIWHCLHFPNELPYRYSFAFSFILITMAYQAYLHLKDITPAQIGGIVGGGFIYLILAERLFSDTFDYKVIYISLGLLAAYAIVLAIYKTGKFRETFTALLLFLVVFGEMTNYTITSVATVGNSNRPGFYGQYEDLTALVNTVESEDKDFYRMELASPWTTNDPAFYGYRGVSQFSSEINSNVTAMMTSIGLCGDPASNSFSYRMSTPVVNSMLNIRYIMGKNSTVSDFSLGTNPLYTSNGSTLYKNKYDLSIGYMANEDMHDWSNEYSNPFDVQNQYIWYATGISTPVFTEIDSSPALVPENAGYYSAGTMSVSSTSSNSVILTYTATETQPVYAFVEATSASSITAQIAGNNAVSFHNNWGSTNALGTVQKGQNIIVTVNFESGQVGTITSHVYGLNTAVWENAYNKLNDETLKVESFSDTHIKGTITAFEDGVFMTSVPYEKGWTIKVDGKKTEAKSIKDAFLVCDLKAGTHTIELSYRPYGFYLSLALSVTSLIALFAIDYVLKQLAKKKPNHILVTVPEDDGMFGEYEQLRIENDIAEFGEDYIENAENIAEVFEITEQNTTSSDDEIDSVTESETIATEDYTNEATEEITEPTVSDDDIII